MIQAIDVLKVLDAFEALVDRKNVSDDAKKLIATELLASVPHEIMAPGCKNTSDAVRAIIRDYIGVKNDRTNPGNGGIRSSAEAEARKVPEDGRIGQEKAEEARPESQEVSSEGAKDREADAPQDQQKVAGAGNRNRIKQRSR